MTKTLNQTDLHQFTGSEHLYRHPMVRQVHYTDGVKHVAEAGEAYWLIDEIAFAQCGVAAVKAEEFQFWRFVVIMSRGVLSCEDGNGRQVMSKQIAYTDFPLTEVVFYFCNGTLMLTSEY